jgi:hypothetical protein
MYAAALPAALPAAAPLYAAVPKFRPEVWYPLAGFGMLSFFCFGIFAVSIWAKINGWLTFALGVAGAGFALTSGMYASRNTWIAGVLKWAADWSPVVAFVLAFVALGLLCYVAVAAIPDRFAPAVSLTAGLAAGAFLLPSLSLAAMPDQGTVWVNARQMIDDTGAQLVEQTNGWFWAPSAKNKTGNAQSAGAGR